MQRRMAHLAQNEVDVLCTACTVRAMLMGYYDSGIYTSKPLLSGNAAHHDRYSYILLLHPVSRSSSSALSSSAAKQQGRDKSDSAE